LNPSILMTIAEVDVIWDGDRLTFLSCAMIDGDGAGPSHGDPDFQDDTTLHFEGKPLNADSDSFIVLPPQLICAVEGIVLGCKATVLNATNGMQTDAVVGDVGPTDKLGEISIACAAAIGVPSSPTTGGVARRVIRYAIWPGVPAVVNGRTYALQPV
jgi:hypothetical protein